MNSKLIPINWEVPYIPAEKTIYQVVDDNFFMQQAALVALAETSDLAHPTGAVLVQGKAIVASGANFSQYHLDYGCERKKLGCKSGEGYDLCEGCDPQFHAEATAIGKALEKGVDFGEPTDLYLWGHWWCCRYCWQKIIKANIRHVFLTASAVKQFKK